MLHACADNIDLQLGQDTADFQLQSMLSSAPFRGLTEARKPSGNISHPSKTWSVPKLSRSKPMQECHEVLEAEQVIRGRPGWTESQACDPI